MFTDINKNNPTFGNFFLSIESSVHNSTPYNKTYIEHIVRFICCYSLCQSHGLIFCPICQETCILTNQKLICHSNISYEIYYDMRKE